MSIKYAILGLLHYRDMHGYEIKNRIETNFAYTWTVNYGQIYTSLKTLVADGDIVLADVIPSEDGAPPKKMYSLTDKGREEFRKWLGSSPQKKVLHRDSFMMRFIFFRFGEKENALRLIDEQIQIHEQQLEQRKADMPNLGARGPYVGMARELGITYTEVRLQWLHKVRVWLMRDKSSRGQKKGKSGKKKPSQRGPKN